MIRLRVHFSKTGDLRFVGHRDLMECFHRLLRRAGIRPLYSQGFHPKPKVSFPTALPLNVEGEDEVLEMEMPDGTDAEDIAARLRRWTVPNLGFCEVIAMPEGSKKAQAVGFTYHFTIPEGRRTALEGRLTWLREQTALWVPKRGKDKEVDLIKSLLSCELGADGVLRFQLRGGLTDGCGPREVLAVLEIEDLETHGSVLVRKSVHIE